MSIVDTAGVSAAEYLERTVGPFIALAAYRKLLFLQGPAEIRARAALGAFRCALRLGDDREIIALASVWSEIQPGDWCDAIVDFCKTLSSQRRLEPALALARAESERAPTPRSLYLLARCLELAGDPSAPSTFARAATAPPSGVCGEEAILFASRARWLEHLRSNRSTRAAALAEATSLDPGRATPAQKLIIASARLWAASRFVRASGLSILEELGRTAEPSIAEQAIRLAAAHADAMGDALTPLEADRMTAALSRWPDPAQREAALARLSARMKIATSDGVPREEALLEAPKLAPETNSLILRARAVLSGGGLGSHSNLEAPAEDSRSGRLSSLALDAVVATRRDRPREAAEALEKARELVSEAEGIPAPLWTAAYISLGATDGTLQKSAIRLFEELLGATRSPPPRGYSIFVRPLQKMARPDLVVRVLRAAAEAREPGAPDLLAHALIVEGWDLAARGHAQAAIAALREARASTAAKNAGVLAPSGK